jgi:hypothetical protein
LNIRRAPWVGSLIAIERRRKVAFADLCRHHDRSLLAPAHFDDANCPIDLTALVATVLGISIVLIPVIRITARFALAPTVKALSGLFEHKGLNETVRILERRIALQKQQIESMEGSLRRLAAVSEFHESLETGTGEEVAPPVEGH